MSEPKSPALIEIALNHRELIRLIEESGGELSQEIEEVLAMVDLAVAGKVDSYAVVMERLEHEAIYWKAKADMYAKVAKSMLNSQARMKEAIKAAMLLMGKTEVAGNDVRFKLQNSSQPKLIIDDATLDPAFTMQVTTTMPDKDRIKEALKAGKEVMGARLEQGQFVKQSVNKRS